MGQTELTVLLTLAATFGQAGFLVGYQVNSSEHSFALSGIFRKASGFSR